MAIREGARIAKTARLPKDVSQIPGHNKRFRKRIYGSSTPGSTKGKECQKTLSWIDDEKRAKKARPQEE